MLQNYARRGLSLLLTLVMLVTMMPVSAFASETEVHDHDHEHEIVIVADPVEVPADPAEEPSVEPVEEPSEDPVESTEPSEEPSEEPVESTEPSEEPSEEPVESTEPSEEPSEEPVESTEPSEEPEVTDEPEVTEDPEETEEPVEPLAVYVSGVSNHIFIDDQAITAQANVAGGIAPYSVVLKINKDGSTVYTSEPVVTEGSASLSWQPDTWGDYEVVVLAYDVTGTEVSGVAYVAAADRDQETVADWDKSVEDVVLTENWGADLLAVAQSQMDYAQSRKDFVLNANGGRDYYSRYGHYLSAPYMDWNVAFAIFCARYAQLPQEGFPVDYLLDNWVAALKNLDAYQPIDAAYAPKPGDLVLLDTDADEVIDRIAILESITGPNMVVIEGDVDGKVCYVFYTRFNSAVVAFGDVESLMNRYLAATATEAPTAEPTEEPTEAPTTEPTQEPAEDDGSVNPAVEEVQAEIDAFLFKWFGDTTGWGEEEFGDAISKLYYNGQLDVLVADYDALNARVANIANEGNLTESDFESFVEKDALVYFDNVLYQILAAEDSVLMATTITMNDGQFTITDTKNTVKNSNGTVTATAKGSLFSKASNTITIKNISGKNAKISFDYSVAASTAFTIDSTPASVSGSVNKMLEADGTVVLVITSDNGLSGTTVTLTMSNIVFTEAAAASNVTFEFDSALGSVTVAGEAIENGTVKEIDLAGAALVATPNGSRFLGWIEDDGTLLSQETTYTLAPAADMTVKAVFTDDKSTPYFYVGGTAQKSVSSGLLGLGNINYYEVGKAYLFDDLNAAATYAAGSSNKGIVLANSGTLPAGTYTIPSGVTLLIPYDDANTLFTTQIKNIGTYTTPTPYRQLTMASGANIVLNGAMSISAVQRHAQGGKNDGGSPTGPCGFVNMNSGSSITVNSGAALYAYGFIYGSGSVTAENGASVYEMFQIGDFRGGTQSTQMDNGVFPLSQYFVQNIEVPLTLKNGAKEYSYTTIYMSSADFGSSVGFIGPKDSMFNLTSGSVTKRYDGATDRLIVEVNGDITISSINMSVGTSSINSKNYELPVTSNITVIQNSGSIKIGQDVAFLPGSQIVVKRDATCSLNSGANIYIYDADQWGTFVYTADTNKTMASVKYAPGKNYNRTDADLVDASIHVDGGTVDASAGYVYTTEGGASVTGINGAVAKLQPGTQTVTHQLVQNTGYTEIPLTIAKLKNADGSYTEFTKYSENKGTAKTFTYTNGIWIENCDTANDVHYSVEKVTLEPTCGKDGSKDVFCQCGAKDETEAIPATGEHTWPEGVAACKPDQKCSVCGTAMEATGTHTEEAIPAVDATCTTTGLTAGKKCSDCGTIIEAPTVTETIPHLNDIILEAKAATCNEQGLTEGKQCSACNQVTVPQQTIGMLGHTAGAAATCTTAQTCTVCGAEIAPAKGHAIDQTKPCIAQKCSTCGVTVESTAAHTPGAEATCTTAQICTTCNSTLEAVLGHDYDAVVTAPTCTEGGYTTDTCSRCSDTKKRGETDALGHNHVATVVAPKCDEQGYTLYECSRCDDSYKDNYTDALEHNYQSKVTPPTCDEGGYTTYECSLCHNTYTGNETAATGHSYGETITKPATCTEDGEKTVACTACGDSFTEGIAALGHDMPETGVQTKAPTCEKEGVETLTCLRGCGETTTKSIPTIDHTPDAGTISPEPTCTETGVKTFKCTVCGAETGTEVVKELGHNYVDHDAKASTCEEAGWKAYQTCTECDLNTQEFLPLAPHTPGAEATCTTNQICTVCDAVLEEAKGHDYTGPDANCENAKICTVCKAELEPAKGHDYTGEAADCDNAQLCKVCNKELKPALGHDYQYAVTAPGCETEGFTTVTCSRCDYNSVENETPAAGHKYGGVVTAPTCTAEGYTTYTCTACHDSYVDDIVEAKGHTTDGGVITTQPGCTTEGVKTFTCTVCETTIGTETVEASGHKPDGGSVTKTPTCTEAGVKTFKCTVCGEETSTESVDALTHDITTHGAKPATCNEIGWDEYETCSRCSYTTYKEIEALGHDEIEHEAKEVSCLEIGWEAYVTCSRCSYTTYKEIPAPGHTIVDHDAKDPTCDEIGWNAYQTCAKCDYTTYKQIDALGHEEVTMGAKKPTCTARGWDEYIVCDRDECDYSTYVEKPALGHDYQAVVKEATCTEGGYTTYTCSRCDDSYIGDEVPKTAHVYTARTEVVAPTCTTEGYTFDYCECGASQRTKKVAALGHSMNDGVVTTTPTCTEPGVKTFTCGVCGETETETVSALGHDKEFHAAKETTCYEVGWDAYETCKRDGCTYTTYKEIEMLPHEEEEHEGKDASCDEGGWEPYVTCKNCDYTTYKALDALGHALNGQSMKPATCTEDGVTLHATCTRCDYETEGDVIPALGHIMVDVEENIKPTCTTPGEMQRKCDRDGCDFTDTREIEALNHDEIEHEAEEPTCTTIGWDAYVTCSRCDYSTYEEIDALGHDYVDHEAKEPSCTEIGWNAYQTCTRCDYSDYEEIEKIDHECTYPEAKEPTCTEVGWDEYEACINCDYSTYKEIEALGHDYIDHEAKEVTCTEAGWNAYQTCSRCDFSSQKKIQPEGHILKIYKQKDPTCVAEGYEAYEMCTECDYTTYKAIDALDHDYIDQKAKAATCTEAGWDAYQTCSRCDWNNKVEISALGHDTIDHEAKAAGCTEIGWEAYVTCSRCDYTTYKEIPALGGHIISKHNAKAVTCTEIGWEAYETCSRCDYSTYVEIPALTHDTVTNEAQAPTCTAVGWDAYETCSRCDYTTKVEKAALGHNPVTHEAKKPTCTEVGWNAYETCSRCDYSSQVILPKVDHKIMKVAAQAPDCTEVGWEAYEYCTECDYTTYVEIAAAGHTEVKHDAKAPTCTAIGWEAYVTCSKCDHSTYVEIGALGHDPVTNEAKEPSCTEGGWDAYETCSRCDYTTKVDKVALGHDPVTHEAVAATCTTAGNKAYETCSRCDYSTFVEVAALGHQTAKYSGKDATCTAAGYEPYEECSRCDYTTYKEIAALGHEPVTHDSVAPTCTTKGNEAYETCSRCDYTNLVEIPALGHDPVTHDAKAPTCTEAGWNAHETCSRCDYSTKVTINATGHTLSTVPAKGATCTEIGWAAYEKCSKCDYTTYVEIEPLGHDTKESAGRDATCTAIGWNAYETCSRCDYSTYEEIAALGHDEEKHDALDPTCTTKGNEAYVTCSRCSYTTFKEIAALGHDEVKHPAQAVTCLEIGWDPYVTCSRCDYTTYKEIAALGHDKVTHEGKEVSCTAIGWEEYEDCSRCDYTTYEVIPALGHDETTHNAQAATCLEIGWNNHVTCSRCDYTTYVEIPALGHEKVDHEAQAPDCTEIGWDAYETCTRCDYTTYVEIPALGHKEVIDDAKAATCTETGLTEGKHCSVCEDILVEQKVVDMLPHTEETVPGYPATCLDKGLTDGTKCSVCGETLVEQKEINNLWHEWDEGTVTTEPTCTEDGLRTYQCVREGCDETKEEPIPAAHTVVVDAAVDPTCTTPGKKEGSHCEACGKVLMPQQTIPAAHAWADVEITLEPTCTTPGEKEVKCTRQGCKATDKQIIPAKGHTEVAIPAVPETCTTDGWTEGTRCSVCGTTTKEQEKIPATHLWGDSKPCTNANVACLREGCNHVNEGKLDHNLVKTYTKEIDTCWIMACSYGCGYTEGRSQPHTLVEDDEVQETCEEPGYSKGYHCSDCGYISTPQFEIAPLGHDFKHYEAKHATYTAPGWDEYYACSRCNFTTRIDHPMLKKPGIRTYQDFMDNLLHLENLAEEYAKENPGKDPANLVIKYIRTGVDRYNSGSWNIMAGYEDAGFAAYVDKMEDEMNCFAIENGEELFFFSSMKDVYEFKLPNGDHVDFGHMFGTMDITYNNNFGVNHADVGGWAGDLVDLLSATDYVGVEGTLDEMIDEISENCLNKIVGPEDNFDIVDMYGDLDAFYIMDNLEKIDYSAGDLYAIMAGYFTEGLSDEYRADYILKNRFGGVTKRNAIRDVVYTEYTSNKVISTLEGTRDFNSENLPDLRRACCYSFADYLCKLAGDYVEIEDNRYYTVYSSSYANLAPGIDQEIHYAYTADDKQIRYYIATADINSEYVDVYANYKDNDPTSWGMQRVRDQANAAQAKYGDPASEQYIENYNVITSINGAGYNMSTGEPGGLLVMGGKEYQAPNAAGFFGILKNGKAVIGTTEEYYAMKDQVQEGIAGFGAVLVKDGKINVSHADAYYNDRASRTAVGITRTGKVVFMVLDGRQEPVSCGGSMQEIAQIMLEAGCVDAVNLDGGGSTTYVARQPGDDEISLVSSPSDGFERSVSTSLMMVSTAPSSTAFDHAVIETPNAYLTTGTTVQMTASGVSATGNAVEIPEGATWAVEATQEENEGKAIITVDGAFSAETDGQYRVHLMVDDKSVGSKLMYVVTPDRVYFTRENMPAIYGTQVELPVKANYQGKEVVTNSADFTFTLDNPKGGTVNGLFFTGDETHKIKNVTVTAALANNASAPTASLIINLFNQGEATFDFDRATAGDRQFAWDRQVSNSTTEDNRIYSVVDPSQDMVTSYIFAIDMTQIPIPDKLADLTYMLPGADAADASAWNFLLQLAERVSVLTEVKPVIYFDPNFEIDYSEMTVRNDYFKLSKTDFNAEENSLTLTLKWVDQTQAIDPAMANPMCILSGIKLTPKDDAAWDSKDRLTPVHTGKVSYTIYLRANALYSFCQKPENQETFNLYPFDNKEVIIGGSTEKGGYFSDVYKTFEDTYTLAKGLKNGWVSEVGGYAYYEDGVRYTGVQEVDGYYYDFRDDGICVGQNKYNGIFMKDGKTHYAKFGLLSPGWVEQDGALYCFDENGVGYDGNVVVEEVRMQFDNGRHLGGDSGFIKKSDGKTYHYTNGVKDVGWFYEGDKLYHFNTGTGEMTLGTHVIPDAEAKAKGAYYDFADDGVTLRGYFNPSGYYYWAGLPRTHDWVKEGSDPDPDAWYRTNSHGHYVTDPTGNETFAFEKDGKTYTAVKIEVDGVVYTFDNNSGKLLKGDIVYDPDGTGYYYWAGKPITTGWFDHNGETYYAQEDGTLATGSKVIDGKSYMFKENGMLVKEGITLIATLNADNSVMTIKMSDSEVVETLRFAIWPQNADQSQTLRWLDARQDDNGEWIYNVPMCWFNSAATGNNSADTYFIHAYANADTAPLVNTLVKVETSIDHVKQTKNENVVDATCTTDGSYDKVVTCIRCNEEFSREKVTVPGGHKTEIIEENKVEGTCTTDGSYVKVVKCTVCGEEISREQIIETAPGHKNETIEEDKIDVTCTTDGSYVKVVKCTVCGEEVSRETIILTAEGHKEEEPVIENEVEVTCTVDGSYETVVYCSVCDEELSRVKTFIYATGHEYTDEKDRTCNVCGKEKAKIVTTPMYRLYNPNTGEHFYTGSTEERDMLVTAGWQYEGVAWNAPVYEGDPVYRTYNPNSGDHHYTMSWEEVQNLVAVGWNYEGVAWNSAAPNEYPQYRLYNPNADCGSHHYTGSTEERDFLVSVGWIYEGIGWFGLPY